MTVSTDLQSLSAMLLELRAMMDRLEAMLERSEDETLSDRLQEIADAILASNAYSRQIVETLSGALMQHQDLTRMAAQIDAIHQNQIQMTQWLGQSLEKAQEDG
jgi:Trp operon repressor